MSQTSTSFPATVNDGYAVGAPGDLATAQPRIFASHTYLAASDLDADGETVSRVRAGNFVWASSPGGSADQGRGTARTALGRLPDGATGAFAVPAGLVKRSQRHPGYFGTSLEGAQSDPLAVPAGCAVEILEYGTAYVKSSTACAYGDAVFAKNADGAIAAGASGAAPSGYSETGWTVVDGGAAGDIITITRWI